MRVSPRQRPTFPQLCVIAREQITAAPAIDNFEWAERIKDRLVALRFDYPRPPHRLLEAMTAVERALAKEWGPRPLPLPPPPRAPQENLRQLDPPWPTRSHHPQGWTSVQRLVSQPRPGAGSPSSPEARVTFAKPLTLRAAECQKAARIIAQAIVDQVERCEAAERKVEELP